MFTVYTLFVGRALHLLRGEGILVWNSVTSIDTWRTDYMYVLFVLKRTLHPKVEQGVWYGVTAIDI